MAKQDRGGISASDIANVASAHGSISLDISGDVKQSMLDFISVANRMVSGSKLGQYFGTTEQLAKRLANAVKMCNEDFKQFHGFDSANAKEVVNTFNALTASANGADVSSFFKGVEGGFRGVMSTVEAVQAKIGKFTEGFSEADFSRMFGSFQQIKDWSETLGISTKEIENLMSSLTQLSGTDVSALTQQLANAQREIASLKDQLDSATSGRMLKELRAELEEVQVNLRQAEYALEEMRDKAMYEFRNFLSANMIDPDQYNEWGATRFQDYFDSIQQGTMSAGEAITKFKVEYESLFQNIDPDRGLFNISQVEEFTAKLDQIFMRVEEIGTYIQNTTTNVPGLLTNAVERDIQNINKEEQALRHVIDEGGQLSQVGQIVNGVAEASASGTQKMGEMSEQTVKLVDSLTALGSAGEESLTAISAIFRHLGTLKDLDVNTDQFNKLKNALEILQGTTGLEKIGLLSNVNLQGFSNLKISTTIGHLATYLPPISRDVDVGKLQALSQVNLSNFNQDNLKVSKASMEHLQELIAQISGKPTQIINNGQTQQLTKEQAAVERLNTTYREHSEAVAKAIEDEQKKAVISAELTAKLQTEKEAMDAVSGSAERGASSGQKYSAVWDKMFLGKFIAEFAKVKAQFDALEDKPAKLAENIRKLEAAENDMRAATNMKDRVDAYERFVTILDVVRTQIGAVNAEAKNSNTDFKSLLNMVKQAGTAMEGIANSSFTNKLREMSAKMKGVVDPSAIAQLKEMRKAYVDMQSAYGTSGPNTEQDYQALINAQIRWKSALAGLNQALAANRAESSSVNQANKEAAQAVKEIANGAAQAEKQIASLNSVFKQLSDKTKFDTSSFERMRELLAQVNNQNLSADQRKSALQDLNALLEESSKKLHAVAAAEKERAAETKAGTAADNKKANLLKQMNGLLDQCTNAERKFAAAQNVDAVKQSYSALKNTTEEVRALISQLQSGSISMEDAAVKARNLGVAFSKANTELKTNSSLFGRYLTTGMQQLKSRLTYSLGLAAMVYKAVGEVKKMVSTAVELDSAMNTLQIVTRASGHEMEEYGRRISSMAKETAQATKDLIDATTVYARLGYSMDESATLSKYTAMLQGVGDIGASEAQNAMTAIIKAFGKNVNDIEDVMDKLVVVGNNFPISVSQLAEGMNNAGSMLAVAGNSFEESIALLTAANTTIQNISKASTGLRTIAARIRKTTTGEDDDGEIVEEAKYQEMINALTKQHVSLVDEVTGEYRSTYDIIRDIAKVWKDMSSMEQAAVVEALAGTRQQNIFASLMTQFGEAEEAMDRMNDSAGELKSSYNIYLDSINAHVKTLSAAFSELSKDFVDSDLAKWAVDLLTNLIELLDLLINKIGALGTVLSISALPGIIKMISSRSFASSLTQLIGMFGMLKSSSTALTTVGTTAASISGSIPIIMAFVAALSTLQHVLQRINQDRQHNISELYTKSISSAKEEQAIYDLYAAYEDARIKQDETEESKRRLKQASEDLAVALGYEKEAADSLNESFAQMSVAQLEKAVSDAKIATDAASREFLEVINNPRNTSFLDSLFGNTNYNEEQFLNIFANKNGIDLVEANNPLSKQTNEERARSLMQVYELMIERQKELSDANETTTKEYQQLSDTIVWMKPQVDKLRSSMDLYAESQENINDIIRGTTDPAKKLGKALDSLSDNAVKSLLTGELNDENLEEIQAVMKEYYSTPEKMMNEILGNSDVVMKRVSKPYEDAKAELVKVQEDIAQKGIDINQTVFGNIDTNNRQVLEWTQDNLDRFSQELQSWGKDANSMAGTISTVLGGSNNYNGVEIAFSPILQTDDGPVLLSQETVNDYIVSLIEELNEQKGEWTTEDLFELDARGIERDGKKINKIIADVGATAKKTGESMHYLGKDGALALAQRGLQEAKGFLDLFTKEITPDGITNATEKSVAELATLRDELSETTKALEEYKTAMEGGEKDDAVKQAAEIYKGAIEDITSGRVDTNRLHAAAKLFFSDEFLNSINWDMERVGRELQNNMWKYLFDPDEQSALDYGQRFAEYVEQNFSRANGVWMEGGNFYYHSLESVAKAFNMSTEAATMFLSALDMYGVNTMRSTEENYKLISSFYTLESKLNDTEAAVREIVKQMDTEGMDEVEIHAVLDDLQKTGVIDLNSEELHAAISNVLNELHNVDQQKPEPTVGLKYDDVIDGVNTIYRILNELVNSGPWIIPISMPEYDTEDKDNNKNNNNNTNGKSGTQGDADAGGKHAGSGGGKTLVNEEGPELISDNGKAFFANGGKPGFVYLSKDAIVFNADETEEILKHGTVRGAIPAHAGGTGAKNRSGLIGRLLGGKSYPAKRQVQGTQVGGNSQTPKQEPVTYWTCPFCGHLNPQTVSRCQSCGRDPRSSVTTTQQTVGTQTITVYQPTADSLQYTDWLYDTTESDRDYEFAEQQARMREQEEKARRDLEELQREKERLAAQKVDKTPKTPTNKGLTGSGGGNYVGGADYGSQSDPSKVDWIAVRINRLQRAIADLEKVASSGFKKLTTRLEASKSQIQKTTEEIDVMNKAYDRYMKEAAGVGLSAGIAGQIQNGTIDINEYDADTRKKIDEYTEWYEKALDCKSAIEELNQAVAQLYLDQFENTKTDFENQLSDIEHKANMTQKDLEMAQAKGYLENEIFYSEMIANESENIRMLNNELAGLEAQFKNAMDSGQIEEGSEAWYQMKQAINEVKEQLADANIQLVNYQKTMDQLNWGYFDYAQERFKQLTQETNFLIELMSNKKLYEENGEFSGYGAATVGMRAVNYNAYMAQADEYAKQVREIDERIAKDPANTELIARREAMLGLQQQSIIAAESEKNAVKSLVQEGINEQVSAMKDLIDAYNESLDSAKDLYEYQKKISEKTKDVATIQKQLAAYTNDDSEETRAKVQKLNKDLEKAQTDLREAERDQSISDQKKLLDNLYNEYQDYLNLRLDNIDTLMREMIDGTNSEMTAIRATIMDSGMKVGYTISEELDKVMSPNISNYNYMFEAVTGVHNVLNGIYENVKAMVAASGATKAYATGGLVDYTGLAMVHGSKSRPELMLNATDTENFLAAAAMMRDSVMAGMSQKALAVRDSLSSSALSGIGQLNITIPIERVLDYNDFVKQLRDDPKFERMINAMTLDRIAGKSAFGKNKIIF